MIKKVVSSFIVLVLIITCLPTINISNAAYTVEDLKIEICDSEGYLVDDLSLDGNIVINGTNINIATSVINIPINSSSVSVNGGRLRRISNPSLLYVFPSNFVTSIIENYSNDIQLFTNPGGWTIPANNGFGSYTVNIGAWRFSQNTQVAHVEMYIFLDTESSSIVPKHRYRTNAISSINSINKIKNVKISANSNTKLGNTLEIVSGKDSGSTTSITRNELKSSLVQSSLDISSATSVKGNALGDNELIGTGTTIKLSDGTEFKSVVYGDSTGDGLINALDINDGIHSFLGDTELTDIQKESLDLKKDGNIDALDFSQMVKSFLGTLDGDIVQES